MSWGRLRVELGRVPQEILSARQAFVDMDMDMGVQQASPDQLPRSRIIRLTE